MARFSGGSGGGEGTVGPQGPAGADGADGADGAPGANGADALWSFEGEWVNGVDYAPGSVVQFEGSSYYHPNGQFSSYAPPGYGWLLVSAKGEDGADGTDGADGADGTNGSPGLVYLGNYVSGNGYLANVAVVKGSDNNLYIATSSGGLGDPVGNSAEWAIFLPKGEDGADGADGSSTDTYDILYTTHNGDGTNVKIGDDVWIGDVNAGNTMSVIGVQDPSKGAIVFGNQKTEKISTDGTNLLLNAINDIVLYPASAFAYIGTPQIDGSNRIATWDYVSTVGATTSSYSPNWTGTGLTYTGTPAVGSYVKIGNLVSFNIKVTLTNVTNFGTGQYSLTLPFLPINDYVFRDGGFHDTSTGNHHSISADAESDTLTMTLWHPGSSARDIAFDHNTPLTLTTADYFYVSGTYIAQ